MAFQKKEWVNRQSEYPNRRILTRTGNADEYEITRSEGLIVEEGDPLDADNLNDLEKRIEEVFLSYDTDGNGVVDNAQKLGGQLPEYYATQEEVEAAKTAADNAATAASNAQSTANSAQTTANNAMPKSAYTLSGTTLTINW